MRDPFSTAGPTGWWLALPFLLAALSSCAGPQTWSYAADPPSGQPVVFDGSVSVLPFWDQRGIENRNRILMYLVPLAPFGWQSYEAPERARGHMNSEGWEWQPSRDLAQAATEELQAANLFREVLSMDRTGESDLLLVGNIESTRYSGRLISYGLSAAGPLLWLFGLPATHHKNELALALSLRNENDGVILWEGHYQERSTGLTWLFRQRSDFEYPSLFKNIMRQAAIDIRMDLGGHK